MTKYHVNPETGRVNICRAKIRCDFTVDGTEPPHFFKKETAQKSAENMLEQKYAASLKAKKKKEEGKVHMTDLLDKNHLNGHFTDEDYQKARKDLQSSIELTERAIASSERYLEKSKQKTYSYNYNEVAKRRKGLENSKEKLYYMKRNRAILLNNHFEFLDHQEDSSADW